MAAVAVVVSSYCKPSPFSRRFSPKLGKSPCRHSFGRQVQSSRICALFWGTKKSVQQQVLDSSLGDFTLTGSGSEGVAENDGGPKKICLSVISSISEVSANDWDTCALDATGPEKFNPFLTHGFLSSLEETGCAVKETGWTPCHIVVKDECENVLGVVPLYLKSHSYGEFVFDHSWADAYYGYGERYYPKFQCCVPFTPVTGPRILLRNTSIKDQVIDVIISAMKDLTAKSRVSSLHITFPSENEWHKLGEKGFLQRIGMQYHWRNRNYKNFDEFLMDMKQNKRKNIRQERKKISAQNLTMKRLRGHEIKAKHWDSFYRFYKNTTDNKWGSPYLTRDFFHDMGSKMKDQVLLVVAEDGDELVAGALNLIGGDSLFGRLWGCHPRAYYPSLHFEACYYQAIEAAIELSLSAVEAGAQGEHKIQRGYLPVTTYSCHYLLHEDFRSNSDLDDFFGGPGFLAWSRMSNLHGWGGPLPQSWLDQQLVLQKKILVRIYELGMNPVLPAFSGNVPAALQNVFPSAKITQLGNWFSVKSDPRWCCTYLLDATDPLFIEIGRAFIEQQLKEYGRTSHIYNCDTFDENTPPVDSPEYISSLGAAIYSGMQSGDSDAVWLMQGWLFSYDPFWRPPQMKALLNSVPLGKLVVLDLFAEVKPIWSTSKQFYGVPYIWCMLHNFAGNIEMYGILDSIAFGPVEARTSENTTMVGVGMSMEGIEQNPVVYDLMSEMAFQHEKVDVKAWINQYSVRRYGRSVPAIQDAWNVLYHTVYNCTDGATDKNRDVIVAFPDVDPSIISVTEGKYQNYGKPVSKEAVLKSETSSYDHPHLWYSTSEVIRALELFIASGNELSASNTYRYDLIDLTRQALAKYANELFLNIIEAYQLNDAHGVFQLSRRFLELVEDMDSLLACHDGFLLGPWLESAKQLAQNEEQEKQYEWNARTQITMWFDNTEEEASLLRDYGNKYWSGLLRDYYGPRAAIYFKYMIESLESGDGFRLKDWRREWIKLTNDWQNGRNVYPVESNGDALITSQWLYNKYLQGTSVFDH